MNTTELIDYYCNLLVIQYKGLPRAQATVQMTAAVGVMPQYPSVQVIEFDFVPTQGDFVVSWKGVSSAAINWNDSAATVQTKLRAIPGLSAITVAGDIQAPAEPQLVVTMTGVQPVPAPLFVLVSSSLEGEMPTGQLVTEDGGSLIVTEAGDSISTEIMLVAITPEIDEIDLVLPLAVMNAYNLTGPQVAEGVQLDVLGKYQGVTRSGNGFHGEAITLDDADFLHLIRMAIVRNNSGSSLYDIDALLEQNFPGDVQAWDYANMRMSYVISTALSSDLVELFVTEGLLPKPMGVELANVIYVPDINHLFSMVTYSQPNPVNISGMSTYAAYSTDSPWLTYGDAIAFF